MYMIHIVFFSKCIVDCIIPEKQFLWFTLEKPLIPHKNNSDADSSCRQVITTTVTTPS